MRKVLITIFILISIGFIGLGIYGAVLSNNTEEKPPVDKPAVPSAKKLNCSFTEFMDIYNANVETNVNVSFDDKDLVDVTKTTMRFMFNDINDYNIWKTTYESNNLDMNVPGVNTNTLFDDDNMILTSIIEQKYSETPQENINEEMPIEYENLKNYFIAGGYVCSEN